jgi:hypothetical protein
VIAHQPQPQPQPQRIRNPRSSRVATSSRIARNERERYTGIVRVTIALGSMLALLLLYVMLTSNLTGLTYAVGKAQTDRAALVEETSRLDDKIAALRSDDRLSAMAARLGMREPQRFALVKLGTPVMADAQPHVAVLSSLAGLFMPAAVARQR